MIGDSMNPPNTIASDTLVEAVARAIYTQSYRNCCGGELPDANDESWQSYLSEAQAALTAITEAGYAVVPREPTAAMVKVGVETECGLGPYTLPDVIAVSYRAMINAVTHCNNNGKAE